MENGIIIGGIWKNIFYICIVCVYISVSISIEREGEREWTLKRRIFSYAHIHLFTVAERQVLTAFS